MNSWNITGNLGSGAEVKYTQGGMAICSFSVAVKSGYGDKQKTTWVKCGLFGKRAEGDLPSYLIKGAQVAISGEAYLDEWDDQQGVKQKMLKLNVDKLDLIGGRPQQNQAQPSQQPQSQPMQPQQAPQPAKVQNNFNDDIPF